MNSPKESPPATRNNLDMRNRTACLSATLLLAAAIGSTFLTPTTARADTPAPAPTQRVIAIDCERAQGPTNTAFKQCVGAGRANEGLRADWQRQLTLAKQRCDFQYIRM